MGDRKTKARILRRETTVPKVPEDPEEEEKQKKGKAAEKVEDDKKKNKDEDMSDAESDEDSSEEETTPKTNGKSGETFSKQAAPKQTSSGEELKARCQKVLETRMKEIRQVFAKGTPNLLLLLM